MPRYHTLGSPYARFAAAMGMSMVAADALARDVETMAPEPAPTAPAPPPPPAPKVYPLVPVTEGDLAYINAKRMARAARNRKRAAAYDRGEAGKQK